VVKFDNGSVESDGGRILAQGTPAAPVVLTSLHDDTVGGDTEKNGAATAPTPGDWIWIGLHAGDTSVLQHTELRFGGGGNNATLQINGSSATLDHVTVADGATNALSCRNLASTPATIRDCTFRNNAGLPLYDAQWAILANASNNTATGNAAGDHYRVMPERPNSPVVLRPDNFPGDVLEVANRTNIQTGGSLSLPPGTILKFPGRVASGFSLGSGATLRLEGTARRPIVLTSFKDDSWGGDTNGDGSATSPAANDIGQIYIGSGSCVLENVLMRFGSGTTIDVQSPTATLRRVRVEHSSGIGFRLSNALTHADNLVAYDCASAGIELSNGTFDLRHATAASCSGPGIRRAGGWSGRVINSIAWGNALDIDGVPPAQLLHSNGDPTAAGANGNRNIDPQFVDPANGDLSLRASSPCIDAADRPTAIAVGSDHDEFPRVLNDALTGATRADMGAYERHRYTMTVAGAATLGGTVTYTIQGPGGLGTFLLGFAPSNFFLPPFGVYLAGAPNDLLAGTPVAMGGSAALFIPNNPAFLGAEFAVQGLGIQLTTLQGGFTNVDRGVVRE